MLQASSPVALLRHSDFRTVLDDIWVEHLDLDVTPEVTTAAQHVLEHARSTASNLKTGVIQTQGQFRLSGAVNTSQKVLVDLVAARLCDVGLLPAHSEEAMLRVSGLMAMRGAQPHTDGGYGHWRDSMFWSLCLEDTDTDVLFGNLRVRIPQQRGTLLAFDPCQPHAVLAREQELFMKSHFSKGRQQFFVGGDFVPKSWAQLGVVHNLSKAQTSGRIDIVATLVDQKTCLMKVSGRYGT